MVLRRSIVTGSAKPQSENWPGCSYGEVCRDHWLVDPQWIFWMERRYK
jgi:hypothetical protein